MFHGWGVLEEIQDLNGVIEIYEGHFVKGLKHGHGTLLKTSREMKLNKTEEFYDGMWQFGLQEGYGIHFTGNYIDKEDSPLLTQNHINSSRKSIE